MLVLQALLGLLDAILSVHRRAHHLLLKDADLVLDLKLGIVINGALVHAWLEVLSLLMLAYIMFSDVVVVMSLDSKFDLLGLLVVGVKLLLSESFLLHVSLPLALLDRVDLLLTLLRFPLEVFSLVFKFLSVFSILLC